MVELDVRRCASGELVVAHNPLVDLDVDGVTEVDELTASELASLDAHDGEGVQTLRTVLDAVPGDTGINLELKDPATVEQALSVARETPHHVVVSSFDADAIRRVDADGGEGVEWAYVLGLTPGDDLSVARDLDCDHVHPNAWYCLLTDVVAEADEAGLTVNAWTVDSRPGAWALARRGVDGLIASSPHVTSWVE
jgi:glycerophosphoryl diester phosphodiesterase